jgi:tetrahydromethanopterin S-methyltransferase subunit H
VVRALEGITIKGAEHDILREVQKGVRDKKSEDAVMLAMKELERSKGRMVRSLGWSQEEGLWRFWDCVYVPMIPDLQCRIAKQHHDLKVRGHTGHWKTLKLVS